MTSDPAIYDYMSQSKNGEGGIYNITNLNLYHYAGNNPVKYTDLDGLDICKLDEEQAQIASEALEDAKENLTSLSASISEYINDKSSDARISDDIKHSAEKYLGIDITNKKEAKDALTKVNKIFRYLSKMDLKDFRYDDDDGDNGDGTVTLAYVYGGIVGLFNKKMYLTDYFFDLPDFGNINKSGTLVHEATHKAIKTKDYAYPFQSQFNDLTKKQKGNNAASWERFYNGVFKNGI